MGQIRMKSGKKVVAPFPRANVVDDTPRPHIFRQEPLNEGETKSDRCIRELGGPTLPFWGPHATFDPI
jgi:hypothetical protein